MASGGQLVIFFLVFFASLLLYMSDPPKHPKTADVAAQLKELKEIISLQQKQDDMSATKSTRIKVKKSNNGDISKESSNNKNKIKNNNQVTRKSNNTKTSNANITKTMKNKSKIGTTKKNNPAVGLNMERNLNATISKNHLGTFVKRKKKINNTKIGTTKNNPVVGVNIQRNLDATDGKNPLGKFVKRKQKINKTKSRTKSNPAAALYKERSLDPTDRLGKFVKRKQKINKSKSGTKSNPPAALNKERSLDPTDSKDPLEKFFKRKPIIKTSAKQGKRKVKFLFVMGLEGTGHHFMQEIMTRSPDAKLLKKLRLHPEKTHEIALMLYDTKAPSLFTSWDPTAIKAGNGKLLPVFAMQESIAQALLEIQDAIPGTGSEEQATITVPVNAIGPKYAGMMSYPNFLGKCRYLQHPNLDLFYQACDMAKVNCSHVYLYRDPYSILKSTLKRSFNNDLLESAHMYVTDLAVMTAQLFDHADRTEGCLGFYETDTLEDTHMWQTIMKLFGWKNQAKFQKFLQKKYKPPKSISEIAKALLVPKQWKPAVDSWMNAHQRTLNICRMNVEKYRSSA